MDNCFLLIAAHEVSSTSYDAVTSLFIAYTVQLENVLTIYLFKINNKSESLDLKQSLKQASTMELENNFKSGLVYCLDVNEFLDN